MNFERYFREKVKILMTGLVDLYCEKSDSRDEVSALMNAVDDLVEAVEKQCDFAVDDLVEAVEKQCDFEYNV